MSAKNKKNGMIADLWELSWFIAIDRQVNDVLC
jgi:hypothetical protein